MGMSGSKDEVKRKQRGSKENEGFGTGINFQFTSGLSISRDVFLLSPMIHFRYLNYPRRVQFKLTNTNVVVCYVNQKHMLTDYKAPDRRITSTAWGLYFFACYFFLQNLWQCLPAVGLGSGSPLIAARITRRCTKIM